jgi:hypothetical protein
MVDRPDAPVVQDWPERCTRSTRFASVRPEKHLQNVKNGVILGSSPKSPAFDRGDSAVAIGSFDRPANLESGGYGVLPVSNMRRIVA